MMRRWPNLDREAIGVSNRKQAMIPDGATVIDPVGTAPGLVVPPREGIRPTVVVLPGPPRELQPMWATATRTDAFARRDRGRDGLPAGDPAAVRDPGVGDRQHAARRGGRAGWSSSRSRSPPACGAGEIEIATRYEPAGAAGLRGVRRVHPRPPRATRCSPSDGVDGRRAGREAAERPQGRRRRVRDRRADGRAGSPSAPAPRDTSPAGSSPTRTRRSVAGRASTRR